MLTVGDYYRYRYNRTIEVLCTLCIVASYLGWSAAQFKVLGLVLNVVTEGMVSQSVGIMIGAAIVLTYTTFGGMFSVAILDFVQISVIMGGLLYIASIVGRWRAGFQRSSHMRLWPGNWTCSHRPLSWHGFPLSELG